MARKKNISTETVKALSFEEGREHVIKSKELQGLSKETIRNYRKFFKHFGDYLEKTNEHNLLNLDKKDANNFVHYLLKKGLQKSTINSHINVAKGTFRTLLEDDLSDNIFKEVKYLKEEEKVIEILTEEDIKAIFKGMNKNKYTEFRDYVIMHVLLDAFSRIGETLSLKINDIDFKSQTITFKKTKSRKIRTVPISKTTIKLLQKLMKECKEFESEYLFLSWNGKPLEKSGSEFSTKMKEYAKRAGVNKRVHPHIFRHTASAHFIKETGNIRVLQKILGHSDLSITEHYAHVLDSTVHDLHDRYSFINCLDSQRKRKTKL